MSRPEDKFDECSCCNYKTNVRAYERRFGQIGFNKDETTYNWYCMFCSFTFLSHLYAYPIDDNMRKIASSIGWISNWFADKLNLDRPA